MSGLVPTPLINFRQLSTAALCRKRKLNEIVKAVPLLCSIVPSLELLPSVTRAPSAHLLWQSKMSDLRLINNTQQFPKPVLFLTLFHSSSLHLNETLHPKSRCWSLTSYTERHRGADTSSAFSGGERQGGRVTAEKK